MAAARGLLPLGFAGMWFTDRHRESLNRDGFAVVRGVIPADVADRAACEIARFVGADLDSPDTWYGDSLLNDGVVPIHHAQSLWDVRQHPNVHQVYSEIVGTHKLMVDINRCCFRPPIHHDRPGFSEGEIHWDIDPRHQTIGWIQGTVLLSDVRENGGGYQCWPEIYRSLDEWLDANAQGADFDFFNPGIPTDGAFHVEGDKGDMIVWSTLLPHGPAPNYSTRPRIASYVSMGRISTNTVLMQRVGYWCQQRLAPEGWRNLRGQLNPEPGPPIELTELGRKLVGLSSWTD